jgi:hypothetical protein
MQGGRRGLAKEFDGPTWSRRPPVLGEQSADTPTATVEWDPLPRGQFPAQPWLSRPPLS